MIVVIPEGYKYKLIKKGLISEAQKRAMKKYYEANKEAISQKIKEKRKGTKTHGKIYKICDNNETKNYIGCTTEQYLSNRFGGHKKGYKQWKEGKTSKTTSYILFDEFGIENCKIVLLEEFEFISKEHLAEKEAEYIKKIDCVNKNIPRKTKEEWYTEHPDYNKNYYEQNKEKYLKTENCDCGGIYSFLSKSQHIKTKRHKKYLENICLENKNI